ncbi:IclR family transcriptional regulator domain-containing protein [Streptomyces sp. MSC1_001]
MNRLGDREETLQLATLEGADVMYLAVHEGTTVVRLTSRAGARLPATCSALGEAMLAGMEDEAVRGLLADRVRRRRLRRVVRQDVLRAVRVDAGVPDVRLPLRHEQDHDQVHHPLPTGGSPDREGTGLLHRRHAPGGEEPHRGRDLPAAVHRRPGPGGCHERARPLPVHGGDNESFWVVDRFQLYAS